MLEMTTMTVNVEVGAITDGPPPVGIWEIGANVVVVVVVTTGRLEVEDVPRVVDAVCFVDWVGAEITGAIVVVVGIISGSGSRETSVIESA